MLEKTDLNSLAGAAPLCVQRVRSRPFWVRRPTAPALGTSGGAPKSGALLRDGAARCQQRATLPDGSPEMVQSVALLCTISARLTLTARSIYSASQPFAHPAKLSWRIQSRHNSAKLSPSLSLIASLLRNSPLMIILQLNSTLAQEQIKPQLQLRSKQQQPPPKSADNIERDANLSTIVILITTTPTTTTFTHSISHTR